VRDGGVPRMKARVGDPAAGGGRWQSLTSLVLPDDAEGGPIFTGQLTGVAAGTASGLWGIDRLGTVRLLLRTGQTLALRDGSARVVSFDAGSSAAGSIGSANGSDATGVVAVIAKFDNGATALVRIAAP